MIGFYVVCALIALSSAVFFYLPRRSSSDQRSLQEENLAWFRRREQELAVEEDASLTEDARLQLLEDESQPAVGAVVAEKPFPVWVLIPIIIAMAALLYYRLGGAEDVRIAQALEALDETTTPAQMQALIASIDARAGQRPDNLHYASLVARYMMGQQDYAGALQRYEQVLQAVPEDAQALAYAAQAEFLASGRTLSDSAQLRAETALATDPQQRTALGLLGMANYERGDFASAIGYWQRLLALQAPGSPDAAMIEDVIARARQQLSGPVAQGGAGERAGVGAQAAAGQAAGTDGRMGVNVNVTLPEGAVLAASDTVFVLARNADSDSRMPIAVVRRRGDELPLQITLDDRNSMAGQQLSASTAVVVSVQVSPSGRPGEANATWLAQSAPIKPALDGQVVSLQLQPK